MKTNREWDIVRRLMSVSWRATPAVRRVQALTVGLALTVGGVAMHMTAEAAGTPAGPATVKTAGGAADLATGDSATVFTLRLPAGAACPGDSANDGYRWQSYMVPSSVDPSTLTFGGNGPLPAGTNAALRQPLFDTPGGSPVVNQLTAPAEAAGGPGRILNIPDVDYTALGAALIDPGTYNIGIACTLGPAGPSQMKNFWNIQKTFTAGSPSGLSWTVTAPSITTTTSALTSTTPAPTTSTVVSSTTTLLAPSTTSTVAPTTTTSTVALTTTSSTVGQSTTTRPPMPSSTVAPPITSAVANPFAIVCDVLRRVLGRFPFLRGLFEALAAAFGC
jgi:hypothetical protein